MLHKTILIRKSGNVNLVYDNTDNLVVISKKIKFNPIKLNKKYLKETHYLPDLSFGTLDIETYRIDEDSFVYSIGYYIHQENVLEMFYTSEGSLGGYHDSAVLVHNCFDKLIRSKYSKRIFYSHNLGGYDAYYIIKNLVYYNSCIKLTDENPYFFESLNRDDSFIKLVVKRVINGKLKSVVFHDSLALLPSSLDSLSWTYDLPIKKGGFPHKFVNPNTFFYKGITPIDYFKNKEKAVLKQDWNLKHECLEYLESDLKSLHQVLSIVSKKFHMLFNEQIVNSLTISSLAMKIFMKNHYDIIKKPLPLIKDRSIYLDIHETYYGGRTEVLKRYGKNLFYYDVNSLYPWGSLNSLCGVNAECVDFVIPVRGISNNMFGSYYCNIKTYKSSINQIGLLPKRNHDGTLIFPLGEWEGWYFSEELKFVQEYGYEIVIYKGYNFDKVDNVFDSYINKLNNIKTNPKDNGERNVAKLGMNGSIGRFGMDPFKETSGLVNRDEVLFIMSRYKIIKHVKISEDLHYISYIKIIDKEYCVKSGLDYIEVLNKEKAREVRIKDSSIGSESISTASAVLSYSRIYMLKVMIYILHNGGNIYYTDTDSLVTDIRLPESLCHPKTLGLFKLEAEIEEGYFIGDKIYAFITKDGKLVKKAKGLSSENLTFEDYKTMFYKGKFESGVKTSSFKYLAEGKVLIDDQSVILDLEYNKRYKTIVDNKWIDTSPLVLDGHLFHRIIPYSYPVGREILILSYKNLPTTASVVVYKEFSWTEWSNLYNIIPYMNNRILNLTVYILYISNGIALDYNQFNSNIHAGITEYIIYISNGIALDYNQFNSNIHAGITEYILYISNGIVLDYNQFNSNIHAGITEYILYISNGIALDYNQFNSKIAAGITEYILYISNTGVALDYQQFQSKISEGIIPSSARFVCEPMSRFTPETYIYYITAQATNGYGLDHQLFKGRISAGLSVYVLYAVITSVPTARSIFVDYQQFKTKIYAGIIIYTIYITPLGICFASLYDSTFLSVDNVYTSLARVMRTMNGTTLGVKDKGESRPTIGDYTPKLSTTDETPDTYRYIFPRPKAEDNLWWLDHLKASPPFLDVLLKDKDVKRLYEGRNSIHINSIKDRDLAEWKEGMLDEFIRLSNILKFEGPQGLRNEKITNAFVYWYLMTSHSYLNFIFDYVTTGVSSNFPTQARGKAPKGSNTWLIRRKTQFEMEIEKLYYDHNYNKLGLVEREGRALEILNNYDKYHTYTLRVEDCNIDASALTKYNRLRREYKFHSSSSASDNVEVGNVQSSLRKKPSNISKYPRGREANDSHSFGKKGGWRNYSTSLRRFVNEPLSRFTDETLISKDDLKKEGIPIDHDFEKYNALTPFRCSADIILSPLYLTKTLLNSLDKSEELLSKLSSDNIVKTFLLNKLNDKFILTAELGCEWANIRKTVKLKERYNRDTPYLNDFGTYFPGISNSKIDFSSYRSNIFILSNVYWRLDGWYNGDYLLFSEILRQGYSSWFEDSLCGCYIVYTRHPLYYYIGYSMHLRNRLRMQRQNILSSKFSTQWDFYISSCCYNKVDIVFMAGPICLYKNYFKAFIQKYPDYKLSVAEFLILRFCTELIGKILEQSLIYYYNPLLNTSIYTTVKNIIWNDKYLNIPYTARMSGVTSNKPSNISKSLGRDTKDSHSFGKNGSRRNYSTKPPRFANVIYPDPWFETLIILDRDDLKTEVIPSLRTQGVDYNFKKYNALTPFKNSSLLFPIVLTKTLLYYLDKSEDCLSKLSLTKPSATENLVKKFLLDMLEQKLKVTVRLLSGSRNLLDIIKSRDPYVKKPIYQKVEDKLIIAHTEVSYSEIDFSPEGGNNPPTKEVDFSSLPCSAANIFRLTKIFGCLHGRFVNNSFEFIEVKKDKSLFDDYKFIPCGCYVIYSKKTLYYYIGYSTNIIDRLDTHYLNLKSLKASRLGDLWDFYIKSCIEKKVKIDIEMGPVCLYPNYLKTFLQKHPDYPLNVGEYFIMELYTDLVGKILEQSLIYHYNPLLNSSIHPAIKNIDWSDKYLTIPYTPKYKRNKVRYWVHWPGPDRSYIPKLRTELYLIQKYNLDIKEVWANLGKLHHYKHSMGLKQPVIIDRIDDNKEIEILRNTIRIAWSTN
jgi:hypothetical protein